MNSNFSNFYKRNWRKKKARQFESESGMFFLVIFLLDTQTLIFSFQQVDLCLQLLENFEDNEATAALR